MLMHGHILRRLAEKAEPTAEDALAILRQQARKLPLQAQLDIASAILDIEAALVVKPDERAKPD